MEICSWGNMRPISFKPMAGAENTSNKEDKVEEDDREVEIKNRDGAFDNKTSHTSLPVLLLISCDDSSPPQIV